MQIPSLSITVPYLLLSTPTLSLPSPYFLYLGCLLLGRMDNFGVEIMKSTSSGWWGGVAERELSSQPYGGVLAFWPAVNALG